MDPVYNHSANQPTHTANISAKTLDTAPHIWGATNHTANISTKKMQKCGGTYRPQYRGQNIDIPKIIYMSVYGYYPYYDI